jgi:D-galactose 1-dehydrogenase
MHLQALQYVTAGMFELTAVADPRRQLGIAGVRNYSTHQRLLADKAVDAVAVLTPPNTHAPIAEAALEAGKHVLLEKPPALNTKEVRGLADTAKSVGRALFTAFHAQYRPEVGAARRELVGEEITGIGVVYKENALRYHQPEGWIFDPAVAGGGVLMDSGINALSVVQFVAPHLTHEVVGAKLHGPRGLGVETKAEVDFTFGPNTAGHLSMDWQHDGSEVRQVSFATGKGDEYTIDVCGSGQLYKNRQALLGRRDARQTGYDMRGEYRGVYRDFARHVRAGRSLVSMAELQFVEQAYSRG